MGSALYREGFRWTEYMESERWRGKHDRNYMVLNYIITSSMNILLVFMITVTITLCPVTLVILVIISISQAIGHMIFDMNPKEENSMNLFNMNEVIRAHVKKTNFERIVSKLIFG